MKAVTLFAATVLPVVPATAYAATIVPTITTSPCTTYTTTALTS